MGRALVAKLAIGGVGICVAGSLAGTGLANYAQSGSFEFYKQQHVTDWEPELTPQPAALQSTDLAFASDRRAEPSTGAAEETLASFTP